MTALKWNLALLVSIASIFIWGCRPNNVSKYNFNEDRYVRDISFSDETVIQSKLTEQFLSEGAHPVSEGVLEQKRVIKESHEVERGVHQVMVDQDYSETKREYKSGVRFPFYGQTNRVDYPLQGKTLERAYENARWTPFSLSSIDDSSNALLLLEMYNFDRRELAISYPNQDIGIGYLWSGTNMIESGSGKMVTCSYTAEFKSLENCSKYPCAKFFIRSIRNEITSNSKLVLESIGYVYRSVDFNVDIGLDFEFEVNYEETFEKDGEYWRMIRKGEGSILGTAERVRPRESVSPIF